MQTFICRNIIKISISKLFTNNPLYGIDSVFLTNEQIRMLSVAFRAAFWRILCYQDTLLYKINYNFRLLIPSHSNV